MIIRHGRAVSQGKQGLFWGGASGGLPSPPPAGALSPAGSGDAAQWAASTPAGAPTQAPVGASGGPPPPVGGARRGGGGGGAPRGGAPPGGGSRDAGAVRRLRGPPPALLYSPWEGGRWHLALSAPCGGTSPKGGGKTWPSASLWWAAYSAPPSGPLRPGGTLPSGRPRRQPRRWHGISRD